MSRYQRIANVVLAAKFTLDPNDLELLSKITQSSVTISFAKPKTPVLTIEENLKGQTELHLGDWLVVEPDGSISACDEATFNRYYRLYEPNQPNPDQLRDSFQRIQKTALSAGPLLNLVWPFDFDNLKDLIDRATPLPVVIDGWPDDGYYVYKLRCPRCGAAVEDGKACAHNDCRQAISYDNYREMLSKEDPRD